MNRAKQRTSEVYLSCATRDRSRADGIAGRLVEAGFRVARISDLEWQQAVAADREETVWGSLRDSKALVILGTRDHIRSPVLTMEVGAALADHKPIHVLIDSDIADDLPAYLQRQHVWPISEVDRLIASLKHADRPSRGQRAERPRSARP